MAQASRIKSLELRLPLIPDVELVAAKAVEVLGRELGMVPEGIEAAAVSTVEACLNALEHGGEHEVLVRVAPLDRDGELFLETEVEDHGAGFDPEAVPDVASSRVHGCVAKRGWGLALMGELMDEVQIRSKPGMTVVRMLKRVEEGT